uniref:Beta-carotene isomerase D27-like C-terminal domain-containing protein n=1 Tax=Linum usitatissimum TaxID=4006 RepID=A0A165G0N8_LINUS|nr:hypothetical protein [Linum usitatissimum]
MKPLELLRPPPLHSVSSASVRRFSPATDALIRRSRLRLPCSSTQSEPVRYPSSQNFNYRELVSSSHHSRLPDFYDFFQTKPEVLRSDYKPGVLDDVFLGLFRSRMVKEVGWDSEKPGYDGLIEVANRLMLIGRSSSYTRDAAVLPLLLLFLVRILVSLFPPFLLELYKMLISPLAGGQIAAVMVARVTQLSCQWLMGKCSVNTVDLPDGTSWESGRNASIWKKANVLAFVSTLTFFNDYMGVPLLMEPNFTDYSCQFKFGMAAPQPEDDVAVKEPCLAICPTASRRRIVPDSTVQCPKA